MSEEVDYNQARFNPKNGKMIVGKSLKDYQENFGEEEYSDRI